MAMTPKQKKLAAMYGNTAELELEKRWRSKGYPPEDVDGVQRLRVPIEEFAVAMNEKSQVERRAALLAGLFGAALEQGQGRRGKSRRAAGAVRVDF